MQPHRWIIEKKFAFSVVVQDVYLHRALQGNYEFMQFSMGMFATNLEIWNGMYDKKSLRSKRKELIYFGEDKKSPIVLDKRKTHNLEIFKFHDS